jgi:hypothetical protein
MHKMAAQEPWMGSRADCRQFEQLPQVRFILSLHVYQGPTHVGKVGIRHLVYCLCHFGADLFQVVHAAFQVCLPVHGHQQGLR